MEGVEGRSEKEGGGKGGGEREREEGERKRPLWSSHHGSVFMNPTGIHEDSGSILGLIQWVKDPGFLPVTVA